MDGVGVAGGDGYHNGGAEGGILYCKIYEFIGEPPSSTGATHDNTTSVAPGIPEKLVGGSGMDASVTVKVVEYILGPELLLAAILK